MTHRSPKFIRELLHYNPETGIFTWRRRDRRWFKSDRSANSWNGKHAGKRAGRVWTSQRSGYQSRQIHLLGKDAMEHHLAWLWMTDDPLPQQMDHKNRDGTDNRWRNLRASTSTQNNRSQSMNIKNTSGVTGVQWVKARGKWRAQCAIRGKVRHVGYFKEVDEAAMAVMEFRADHGFDPGHGLEVAPYRHP